MEYYRVGNWDKWQTFRKDRGAPPWIKVHKAILTNPEFAALSDSEKWHMVGIWLVASERSGMFPGDALLLRKILGTETEPDLEKFLALQLIEKPKKRRQPKGNRVTTKRLPNDRLEIEKEKDPPIVPPRGDEFAVFWSAYPRREGKGAAQKAWGKLDDEQKRAALAALPAHAERWATSERQYIPHPSTWLNQRRWEDEIHAPEQRDVWVNAL